MAPDQITELRRKIYHFLDEQILGVPEGDRSKLQDLVLETGRAFGDVLLRYAKGQRQGQTRETTRADRDVTDLMRSYNELNRRDLDIEALDAVRRAPGGM